MALTLFAPGYRYLKYSTRYHSLIFLYHLFLFLSFPPYYDHIFTHRALAPCRVRKNYRCVVPKLLSLTRSRGSQHFFWGRNGLIATLIPLNSPRVILNSLVYATVNGFKKQVSLTALPWPSKAHHLRRDADPFHMAAYRMSVIFAQERYFDRFL
jgi:hypothetical protein